jgi:hypothetical protein
VASSRNSPVELKAGSRTKNPEKFTDDLLTRFLEVSRNYYNSLLAEGEGFEPPDLSVNGFQDRRLKPLGHPSVIEC